MRNRLLTMMMQNMGRTGSTHLQYDECDTVGIVHITRSPDKLAYIALRGNRCRLASASRRPQDEMHARVCLDDVAHLADFQVESCVFKGLLHLSLLEHAQISAM